MLITPVPSDEEAAAIAAALQVVLNSGGGPIEIPAVSTTWRFSGRPWSSPRYGARTTR